MSLGLSHQCSLATVVQVFHVDTKDISGRSGVILDEAVTKNNPGGTKRLRAQFDLQAAPIDRVLRSVQWSVSGVRILRRAQ